MSQTTKRRGDSERSFSIFTIAFSRIILNIKLMNSIKVKYSCNIFRIQKMFGWEK